VLWCFGVCDLLVELRDCGVFCVLVMMLWIFLVDMFFVVCGFDIFDVVVIGDCVF